MDENRLKFSVADVAQGPCSCTGNSTCASANRIEALFQICERIDKSIRGNGAPGINQEIHDLKQWRLWMEKKEEERKEDYRAIWPQVLPWSIAIGSAMAWVFNLWHGKL